MGFKQNNYTGTAAFILISVVTISVLVLRNVHPDVRAVQVPQFGFASYRIKSSPKKPFDETLQQVCQNAKIRVPEYQNAGSLLDYLENVDSQFCTSWLQFGGEKPFIDVKAAGIPCTKQYTKKKFICMERKYKMIYDPCLIYSFSDEKENNFEKELSRFNCEVHTFQYIDDFGYEEARRNKLWWQHNWELSNNVEVHQAPIFSTDEIETFDRKIEKSNVKRMPLDLMVDTLGHREKTISFLNSNNYPKTWKLLQQIITNHDQFDIQQLGIGVSLNFQGNYSMTTREKAYTLVYKILKGMACIGYRIAKLRPMLHLKKDYFIPGLNRTVYEGYEVNFIKDQSLF